MAHTKESMKKELKAYNRYYSWLLDQILFKEMKRSGRSYIKLMKYLKQKQFTWIIPNDENRADDGRYLRITFRELTGEQIVIKGSCSVLEMCIALAARITEDLFEYDPRTTPAHWFWVMMENSGLDQFTDGTYDEREVERIVDMILLRRYSKTGKGGFFPLKHPNKDQREVEIWYQLQKYILENYDY